MTRPAFIVALLVVISAPPNVSAYMKGYLPLDDKELSLRFPLRTVRTKFVQGMSARIGNATARFEEGKNEIRLSGVDLSGKTWIVTAGAWMGGALYSADLDHNGQNDIIYASYTGGNGLAPPMHVLTILLDADGHPVPSEMDGYFEIDGRGLTDLVDLDRDGRAELIRQSFDDGYWITSLYEARDARWCLIKGQHANRRFPLYTRFTTRANRVPTTPLPGRNPVEDDLSNAFANKTAPVTINHLQWADVQQSGNPKLRLSDGRECDEIGWYSTAVVILNGPERRAATLGAPEIAKQLLETIVRQRIPVRIAGSRRNRDDSERKDKKWCALEMVWGDNSDSTVRPF